MSKCAYRSQRNLLKVLSLRLGRPSWGEICQRARTEQTKAENDKNTSELRSFMSFSLSREQDVKLVVVEREIVLKVARGLDARYILQR